MSALKSVENQLAGVFKGFPQLPDSTKEGLAKFWPWLALIGGILQLLAAVVLFRVITYYERLADLTNSLSVYYGVQSGLTSLDKTLIYVGVAMLVVDAVLLLMAFPHLQKRNRKGWDLLFLAAVINLLYSVVQIFTYGRGVGSFIFGLIGSAIGFYLLFQVREKFNK